MAENVPIAIMPFSKAMTPKAKMTLVFILHMVVGLTIQNRAMATRGWLSTAI